ncbi:MAG: hypothetical protein KGH79_04290, partial [Patescibacteria group bacterium]|nr:hypothetical protein [Patescibacteria group bacterium]
MATYFTGKGYGVSKYVDVTGVPLLSWLDPDTNQTITLFDRVAVQVDPTIKQPLQISQIDGGRMDLATSSALKTAVGGTSAQELDHIISLELGGSNQIANLGLDTNVPGTKNNTTDTFENQLSAAVQAGSMSLLDAWRAEAKAKGKVLAEDLKVHGDSSLVTAAESALGGAWQALSGGVRGDLNTNIQAQIAQDKDTIAATPYDLPTRTKIFTEQINLTAEQLNLSSADAAAYMKVYTARYAQASNQNPKEIFGALTANEQQLMGVSGQDPNLLNIRVTVWINVAAAALVGQAIVGIFGIITLLVIMFVGAPEEIATAEAGGSILSFLTRLGVTGARLKTLVGTYAIYEFLGAMDTRIPMITKQLMDAKYIVPSLISTALKDDMASLKSLSGSTKSSKTSASTAAPSYPPTGSGVSGSSVSGTGVHVSVVSGGVLGSPATFTPSTSDIFEDMNGLQTAAEENIAKYLGSLPGHLVYEIRLASRITLADGTVRIGTTQSIIKGYTKGSSKTPSHATYKKVTNKFAVADIYYLPLAGGRHKIDEVVIGAVDETGFRPTAEDLADLGNAISSYLVSNQLGGVTQINLPSSGGSSPAGTSTPSPTAPTTTPSKTTTPPPTTPAAQLPTTYTAADITAALSNAGDSLSPMAQQTLNAAFAGGDTVAAAFRVIGIPVPAGLNGAATVTGVSPTNLTAVGN